MRVYKCDKCKNTIPDKDTDASVHAGLGYGRYQFCKKCGDPIARILKQYKLEPYGKDKK